MRCQRADDLSDNDTVIQDMVFLIDRPQVVSDDPTGKNSIDKIVESSRSR